MLRTSPNVRRAVRACVSAATSCLRASSTKAAPKSLARRAETKNNTPMDHHWFRFTGLTAEALKAELAIGKGDGEMLAWIEQNTPHKRTPWEIQQWSGYHNERGPDGGVGR